MQVQEGAEDYAERWAFHFKPSKWPNIEISLTFGPKFQFVGKIGMRTRCAIDF